MNLTLSEEQGAIIEMAKKYAESELAPVAARLDVGANKEADRTLFLKNLQGLAELGFMGMNVKADTAVVRPARSHSVLRLLRSPGPVPQPL